MTKHHQVLVIGGGLAGIAAALRAQELGSNVGLLERDPEFGGGGNIRISGGLFHLGGPATSLAPPTLPVDEALAHITALTKGQIRQPVARMLATRAAGSIQWLKEQGVPFMPERAVIAPRGGLNAGRQLNPLRAPDIAMRKLHGRLIENGGTIYNGARAQACKAQPNGWLVTATSPEKKGLEVEAPAVIIADGGFQADPALVDRYIGAQASKAVLRARPNSTGDGLRLALALGASVAGEGHGVYGHVLHRRATQDENFLPYPLFDALCLIAPMVDERGKLFEHGVDDGVEVTVKMLTAPDPNVFSLVLDETMWTGRAVQAGVNPTIVQKGGQVDQAATLAELAKLASMDARQLTSSIERHNASQPHKLAQPPFYRIPLSPGITFTMPGIAINERAEVLRTAGEAIPGVYAAGSCTGSVHGKVGGGGYLGGLNVALVTGLVAGESAAAFAGQVPSAASRA